MPLFSAKVVTGERFESPRDVKTLSCNEKGQNVLRSRFPPFPAAAFGMDMDAQVCREASKLSISACEDGGPPSFDCKGFCEEDTKKAIIFTGDPDANSLSVHRGRFQFRTSRYSNQNPSPKRTSIGRATSKCLARLACLRVASRARAEGAKRPRSPRRTGDLAGLRVSGFSIERSNTKRLAALRLGREALDALMQSVKQSEERQQLWLPDADAFFFCHLFGRMF